MARTSFTGPVASANGFITGSSTDPLAVTTAGNVDAAYATTSATTGDTRLTYSKLTFTSTGSGETARFFSVVTGAGAAAAGTINGAHVSMSVTGSGTIAGAANALRVTLGLGAATNAGGTLASLQLDSDIAADATVPATAAYIRVSDSGATALGTLMNVPAAMLQNTTATATKGIKIVDAAGNDYFILCAAAL